MELKTMADLEAYFYGPQSEELFKGDSPLTTAAGAAVYQRIYGQRVWLQMSKEMNLFSLLPKKPWDISGFRVFKSYLDTSTGIAEDASIPDSADVSSHIVEVSAADFKPKTLAHTFEVSEVLDELSKRGDDIMGDPLNTLKEFFALQHVEDMNVAMAKKCGDLNMTTSSNEMDSIDHVVSGYAEVDVGTADSTDVDIYGIDRGTSATWADAQMDLNSGTLRSLTLALLDDMLRKIWERGGAPKVIVTGYDTQMAISQLLEAQRRYTMPVTRVTPTYAGVKGIPGTEGGFIVSMYNGIPIIPSRHINNDGTGSLSRIYFLDTDYLEWDVLRPTGYLSCPSALMLICASRMRQALEQETPSSLANSLRRVCIVPWATSCAGDSMFKERWPISNRALIDA